MSQTGEMRTLFNAGEVYKKMYKIIKSFVYFRSFIPVVLRFSTSGETKPVQWTL